MPIYEFFCPECSTIFSFWSKSMNTEKRPPCPGCKNDVLQRKMSRFAMISGGKTSESGEGMDDLPIDESKMESAMESLMSEAEGLDENDPKAAARLMRKLSEKTGLQYNENIENALSRLESGEDPEAIEAEMGDSLEGEEMPFVMPGGKGGGKSMRKPRVKRDETLYEM